MTACNFCYNEIKAVLNLLVSLQEENSEKQNSQSNLGNLVSDRTTDYRFLQRNVSDVLLSSFSTVTSWATLSCKAAPHLLWALSPAPAHLQYTHTFIISCTSTTFFLNSEDQRLDSFRRLMLFFFFMNLNVQGFLFLWTFKDHVVRRLTWQIKTRNNFPLGLFVNCHLFPVFNIFASVDLIPLMIYIQTLFSVSCHCLLERP